MTATTDFERALLADIPMAQAMQLHVRDYDGERLRLTAPLAPNINDKGCAFGGSLISLLTLAGWGLIVLRLRALNTRCDVYVQDSVARYLAPVWEELVAEAQLAEGESWEEFMRALEARGSARLRVNCRVSLTTGADACTMDARFVAIVVP